MGTRPTDDQVREALADHEWNISHAALALGMTRAGLYYRIRVMRLRLTPAAQRARISAINRRSGQGNRRSAA
jgi:transcriptional regulator with PAS, ATPase and Fis domain